MKNILLLLFSFATINSFGQFLTQGKITFERKTNLRQSTQTEEKVSDWVKEHIKDLAQFTISEFSLTFNKEASIYKFEKEQDVTGWKMDWAKITAENKVYTDFKSGMYTAEKKVFENDYLVEDTIPEFQWKIVDEMRTIAGYPCRKAITKICDSVVVVAFYCDEIMVNGGPESFNGLPGMILGIAIPRLYTTWFATNVEVLPQEVVPFKPGRKVKKVSVPAMIAEVKNGTKDWGNWADPSKMPWWLTI